MVRISPLSFVLVGLAASPIVFEVGWLTVRHVLPPWRDLLGLGSGFFPHALLAVLTVFVAFCPGFRPAARRARVFAGLAAAAAWVGLLGIGLPRAARHYFPADARRAPDVRAALHRDAASRENLRDLFRPTKVHLHPRYWETAGVAGLAVSGWVELKRRSSSDPVLARLVDSNDDWLPTPSDADWLPIPFATSDTRGRQLTVEPTRPGVLRVADGDGGRVEIEWIDDRFRVLDARNPRATVRAQLLYDATRVMRPASAAAAAFGPLVAWTALAAAVLAAVPPKPSRSSFARVALSVHLAGMFGLAVVAVIFRPYMRWGDPSLKDFMLFGEAAWPAGIAYGIGVACLCARMLRTAFRADAQAAWFGRPMGGPA